MIVKPERFQSVRNKKMEKWTEKELQYDKQVRTKRSFSHYLYLYTQYSDGHPNHGYNKFSIDKNEIDFETLKDLCKKYDVRLVETRLARHSPGKYEVRFQEKYREDCF